MHLSTRKLILILVMVFASFTGYSQLTVTNAPNATALAQRLVGDGISISNVTFTGNTNMAGFFKRTGNSAPGLDSGIVLTSGRAKTNGSSKGVDGNNSTQAQNVLASTGWNLPGDQDLADQIGANVDDMNDACVLEFDFIPTGDSIKFRYVFSSEEYDPSFACGDYNDAFAFFVSGPGISGLRNIALVPNTNLAVSISSINNVPDAFPSPCLANTQYYRNNITGTALTHDGYTTVLTAQEQVQPCQVYHMKLVIADNSDAVWDSGVFLEAKSLTSTTLSIQNTTQIDANGNSYLVEGCLSGTLTISRSEAQPIPKVVNLGYGGTAVNGLDIQNLPATVTIPANETSVQLSLIPIVDNLPEGVEILKIYTMAGCSNMYATDSTIFQIRDYDTLTIVPDTLRICRNSSVQLAAHSSYATYQWSPTTIMDDPTSASPIVTPPSDSTKYYCTSTTGNCHGKDSAFIFWKKINIDSVQQVNCNGESSGIIYAHAGPGWTNPQFSVNSGTPQASGILTNLPVGSYIVSLIDGSGCTDTAHVNIVQQYPTLVIDNITTTDGGCTAGANGTIVVAASGGDPAYTYSAGGPFAGSSTLSQPPGTYTVTVKDNNGCTVSQPGVTVTYINSLTLALSSDTTVICEGTSTQLHAVSNATALAWSPAGSLNTASGTNVMASPKQTTLYHVTATLGICSLIDSIPLSVNTAPVPEAGDDQVICYGGSTQLSGSGGIEYTWTPSTFLSDPQAADPLVDHPRNITYSLAVVDANGCHSLSDDHIKITLLPPAELYAGKDTVVAVNQPLQLHAIDVNHTGFTTYSWTPAAIMNNPDIPDPIATLKDEFNTLIVYASTPSGCTGTDTIKVQTYRGPEVYVPNAFTPNADGLNDILKPVLVGMRSFGYFHVYNRYGQMIFSTSSQGEGWDGRFQGKMQGMGTYIWMVEAVDYKGNRIFRKGYVTIMQ
jgi:gliding motility-associated-like protein